MRRGCWTLFGGKDEGFGESGCGRRSPFFAFREG